MKTPSCSLYLSTTHHADHSARTARRVLSALAVTMTLLFAVHSSPTRADTSQAGRVVAVENGTIILFIERAGRLNAGDPVDVVRKVRRPGPVHTPSSRWKLRSVASARIVELLDEQQARAEIVAGTPRVRDRIMASRPARNPR
ncbi:MAG TPA: hypothetical protein PKZ76_05095 [Xanthomonadaceae bacterium]|nr:hypothetical protein [Xanthomonadaceae bacterium]